MAIYVNLFANIALGKYFFFWEESWGKYERGAAGKISANNVHKCTPYSLKKASRLISIVRAHSEYYWCAFKVENKVTLASYKTHFYGMKFKGKGDWNCIVWFGQVRQRRVKVIFKENEVISIAWFRKIAIITQLPSNQKKRERGWIESTLYSPTDHQILLIGI